MTVTKQTLPDNLRFLTKKVLVPTYQGLEVCEVQSILYVEALENYCRLFLTDGSSLLSSQSFGSFSLQLFDYGFFQCHKSYTINFSYIMKYNKTGHVELKNGKQITVARRRKEDFLLKLKEWCATNSWLDPNTYLNRNLIYLKHDNDNVIN